VDQALKNILNSPAGFFQAIGHTYQYTAHIFCLFQSTDPALPKVVHDNTCAHEMNVVSTASVLP
jgi:hypothetical protein